MSPAVKEVIVDQLAEEIKNARLTKLTWQMQTSRAQIDRLLNSKKNSATLETLMRAAKIVGRELRLELV